MGEAIVRVASRRENDKALGVTKVSAALWLDDYEKAKAMDPHRTMSIEEQFILACGREPRLPVGWETKSLKVAGHDLGSRWRRCWKDTLVPTVPGLWMTTRLSSRTTNSSMKKCHAVRND